MASRLSSSAWLWWASLWLWATLCSWLWVRVRCSSNSLRREASSLHCALCSFSCPSRCRALCSISSIWARRTVVTDVACLTSSFSWLGGRQGLIVLTTKSKLVEWKSYNLFIQIHIMKTMNQNTVMRQSQLRTSRSGSVLSFLSLTQSTLFPKLLFLGHMQ